MTEPAPWGTKYLTYVSPLAPSQPKMPRALSIFTSRQHQNINILPLAAPPPILRISRTVAKDRLLYLVIVKVAEMVLACKANYVNSFDPLFYSYPSFSLSSK